MGNLFISFTVAIFAAVSVVSLSRAFDFDFYISRTLPLIPILYAVIYELLEHRKKRKTRKTALPDEKEVETAEAPPVAPRSIVERVLTGLGVGFSVKFLIEMFLLALFLRFGGQSFSEAYGSIGIQTVGRFLRGEHPWLMGNDGIMILAMISIITCFITGLWIGHTARGNAILEGVLVGAVVSVIMAMTNMLILYQKIEEVTVRLADSMGYAMKAGFLVVIALQVLLYGLWSGLVQIGLEDREKMKEKKPKKKAKK
ncbi:MAG TPA: hypothetical protein VIX18_07100 [Nitrospirota bacterium]